MNKAIAYIKIMIHNRKSDTNDFKTASYICSHHNFESEDDVCSDYWKTSYQQQSLSKFHLPKDQIPNDKNKVSPLLYSCDVSMNIPLDTCIFLVYLV